MAYMAGFVDNPDNDPSADDPASAGGIAHALEEDIVFGRLMPGSPLREERLLERFGGSRHVIRDALTRLEASGLVVRERNRGAMVRVFSADEVNEVHEVRELLQRQAALRIRLPVSDTLLLPVEQLQLEYERAVSARDAVAMYAANDRFHDALFGLCGNRQLQQMIRQLLRLSYLVRVDDVADDAMQSRVINEHRLMISLLRGTDGWALSELCVAHIRPRRDAYRAFLEQQNPQRKRRSSKK